MNNKNMSNVYIELDLMVGTSIDKAVKELLEFKKRGELAKACFNGKMLYSDTVTLDSAYRLIVGKTREEHKKYMESIMLDIKQREEEHKAQIPKLIENWVKEGKEVLTSDKWTYWEEIVPVRVNDLYHGMELGNCLDVIRKLKSGTFEDAKVELYNQEHSGMSHSLVCAMIKEFYKDGEEFVAYLKNS